MSTTRKTALFTMLVFVSFLVLTTAGPVMRAEAQPADTYTCYFYSESNRLIDSVQVTAGNVLTPVTPPNVEGMRFSHWYQVNDALIGDAAEEYLFNSPVTGPIYLKACYVQVLEATGEPEAVKEADEAGEVLVADETEAPEAAEVEETENTSATDETEGSGAIETDEVPAADVAEEPEAVVKEEVPVADATEESGAVEADEVPAADVTEELEEAEEEASVADKIEELEAVVKEKVPVADTTEESGAVETDEVPAADVTEELEAVEEAEASVADKIEELEAVEEEEVPPAADVTEEPKAAEVEKAEETSATDETEKPEAVETEGAPAAEASETPEPVGEAGDIEALHANDAAEEMETAEAEDPSVVDAVEESEAAEVEEEPVAADAEAPEAAGVEETEETSATDGIEKSEAVEAEGAPAADASETQEAVEKTDGMEALPATDAPGIAKVEVVEEVQPLAVDTAFALDTIELLEDMEKVVEAEAPPSVPATEAPAKLLVAEETLHGQKNADVLISETEVNAYLVRFYDAHGQEWWRSTVVRGQPVSEPDTTPDAPDGMEFAHWFQVDQQLKGDPMLPYDFERPITGITYIMAHYTLPAQAVSDAIPETNEPVDTEPESVSISLYAALAVEGVAVEDGQFVAQLIGKGLPAIQVRNIGDRFFFPEIVFTKQQIGDHVYRVRAVVDVPQHGYTYDQATYKIHVRVAEDEQGLLTASVIQPDADNPVTITHSYSDDIPMVRVYIDVHAGRELSFGDPVCFTAEAINCGDNPQYQWQFSEDNRNWIDVTGATSPQLNIILTDGNVKGYWRVGVTITD